MKKQYLFAGLVLLAANTGYAQTKIGAPGAPDGSAMLEVTSGAGANKGLLLPKVTTAQRNAITNPATGLVIYNTTTNAVEANTGTPAAPIWSSNTAATAAWTTTGNAGTDPATNFLGTTDAQPMVVRTNNAEKLRVTADGKVGIGKTAPALKLDVLGGINLDRDILQASNQGSSMVWSSLTYNGGATEFVNFHGTGTGGYRFYDLAPGVTPDSSAGELMRITGDGAVGIGTSAPASKLNVNNGTITVTPGLALAASPAISVVNDNGGPGYNDDIDIRSYGTNTAPGMSMWTGRGTAAAPTNAQAGDYAGILRFGTTVNNIENEVSRIQSVYVGDGTNVKSNMTFSTSAATAMTIDSNGSVGIGTGAPLEKLDVAGVGNTAVQVTAGIGGQMRFQMGNANHGIIRNLTSSGGGGNDVAVYTSNGGGGADLYLVANPVSRGADSLALDQFVLKNSGNVGIGTNAPAQKLHVEGTARVTTATGTPTTITGRNADGDVGNVAVGTGLALTGGTLSVTGSASNWSLTGNAGTNPATNFLGTTDNQPMVVGTNSTEKMRIQPDGSIGMNTSTPGGAILSVNTNAPTDRAVSFSQNNKVKAFIVPQAGFNGAYNTIATTGDAGIFFPDSTGGEIGAGAATSRGFVIAPHTNIANGASGLKVTERGNVGIGKAEPALKLDVLGGINLDRDILQASNQGSSIVWSSLTYNGGATEFVNFHGTGTGGYRFYDLAPGVTPDSSAGELMRITGGGAVGIGTSNPTAKLQVNSGTATITPGTTVAASPAISVINDGGGPGFNDDIDIRSYGASTAPGMSMWTARGTAAAPVNAQAGDYAGIIRFGTQINNLESEVSRIQSVYQGDGTNLKSNLTFTTSGIPTMTIDSNGYVGIGNMSPRAKLDVNGGLMLGAETPPNTGNATWIGWSSIRTGIGESEFVNYRGTGTGGFRFYSLAGTGAPAFDSTNSIAFIDALGAYNQTSDARVKTNVNTINEGLKKVMALHPVSYDFHKGRTLKNGVVSFTKDDETVETIGFLAQELVKVVPEAVDKPKDTASQLYSVSYATLVPVLTKAIQEQQAEIAALKAELAAVKTDNTALKADASKITELADRMKQLEKTLGITPTSDTLTASK